MSDTSTMGRCRICGCTEADGRLCVERTGQPCSWTSPAKDLCTACAPLAATEIPADWLTERDRKTLRAVNVSTIVGLLDIGLTVFPRRSKFVTRGRARVLRQCAERWIRAQLLRTVDGDPLPDMTGDLAPQEDARE